MAAFRISWLLLMVIISIRYKALGLNINEKCTKDEECLSTNLVCQEVCEGKVCRCEDGYSWSMNNTITLPACMPRKVETCTTNTDCTATNTKCFTGGCGKGYCICAPDYFTCMPGICKKDCHCNAPGNFDKTIGRCRDMSKKLIGETCSSDEDCYIASGKTSTADISVECRDGLCACAADFKPDPQEPMYRCTSARLVGEGNNCGIHMGKRNECNSGLVCMACPGEKCSKCVKMGAFYQSPQGYRGTSATLDKCHLLMFFMAALAALLR